MKRLIQSLTTGQLQLLDCPIPIVKPGHVLIRTYHSVISKGTEESLFQFGKASWFQKARMQPEKLNQIKMKLKTDGWAETLAAIKNKLETPLSPGYSQSGIVVDVGRGVSRFSIGDRGISNGPHSEFVCVSENLCLKIPEGPVVSFEDAAFTPIAAIALQGIRLLNPTLGETIVVQGLGLLGLITVQLLKAQGCRVLGIDFEGPQLDLAKKFGAETHSLSLEPNPVSHAMAFSNGQGIDGVIVTASTKSSAPIQFAAQMSRKRGKIVLVGVTGTQFNRSDFYEKELSFQVSCSYGPGRYEHSYEQKGFDYPIGFVRWTEQRNMQAILELIQERKLSLSPLITHRFPFNETLNAYEILCTDPSSKAIVLSYPIACSNFLSNKRTFNQLISSDNGYPTLGIIGAGAHCTKTLLPAFNKLGAEIRAVTSESGLSAALASKKFKIPEVMNTSSELIESPLINTVIVGTRHNTHSELVIKAIKAHKNIFVEKPLATTLDQIDEIEAALRSSHYSKILCVGFNRRFSPLSIKLKSLFHQSTAPKMMVYTINALSLPSSHWVNDPEIGGGRLISELGHFIDLLRFFADSPITHHHIEQISSDNIDTKNNITLTLKFANGSLGNIHYTTLGNRQYPKERVEVFCGEKIGVIDNFKKLTGFGFSGFKKMALWKQDKGHYNCLKNFISSIQNRSQEPQPLDEFLETSRLLCKIKTPENISPPQKSEVA
jgi:predicted dehydrogenase/threonine dehydrogenase-like Zn-dependent dehydrogenase